jgi:hypothetical protein
MARTERKKITGQKNFKLEEKAGATIKKETSSN